MYTYILIPTDGSEVAEKAVAAGTDYAREAGAKVLFFTAVPEYQLPGEAELLAHKPVKSVAKYEEEAAARAREILDKAAASAKQANVAFETDFALCNRPYEAIIGAAKRHGCDAIFMASHGRSSIAELVLGSVTHQVLAHSKIPVLVYR